MYKNLIYKELYESLELLKTILKEEKYIKSIEMAAKLIANTFKIGGKVFFFGNGGSHCDAMHFAEELVGRYRKNRPGYPAIVISDSSYITCASNDFGYENVFSRYIEALGKKEDTIVGISTSGNSNNILNAINIAQIKNMKVITLTGKDGGKLHGKADVQICVPHFGYADRIQEIHMKTIHILVLIIEKEMLLN